jgi:RNA polymerase sigma factor (TIGR02999 family)
VDQGDREASERLAPLVYVELKRLAHARLRRLPPGQTLQTTALVHEAWMKLARGESFACTSRAHFFGAAASAMRDVLVDQARRKATQKRGGDRRRGSREELANIAINGTPKDFLDLNAALSSLEGLSPRKAQVVSLRFFAGLKTEEIAEALDITTRSVERDWRFARAWLRSELDGKDVGGEF